MKAYLLALCLLGCSSAPPAPSPGASGQPAPTSASPSSATASPQPAPSASATPTAEKVSGKEAVRRTREFLHQGISNEVRTNLLVDYLFENGKRGLYLHWDQYEESPGVYEVVFYAEPLASKGKGSPTPTPSATPRTNPFARPPRPKSKGVELSWLYHFKTGQCKANNPATVALMSLKPRLDSAGLEQALPQAWRQAEAPPTLVSTPPSQPSIEPPAGEPEEVASTPEPAEALKLIGFIGEGKERRAVLTYRGESHELKVGEKMGTLRVKEINDEDVLLELGRGEETRLMPGQEWSPDDF